MLISILCCLSNALFAQQAVITFHHTEYDFGQIKEADGRVTTVFTFTNTGDAPLVISNVRASCGCTMPFYSSTPIEAGQTGTIRVTYDPAGRPGYFTKSITVTSNATIPTTKLYIKGIVIPREAKPEDKYPVQMGNLRLSKKELHFGNVKNTKLVTKTIEYANFTDAPITIEVYQRERLDGLTAVLQQTTLQPHQIGVLDITIDGTQSTLFGLYAHTLYVVVNGKRQLDDAHKVSINANIVEDFTMLTSTQRQQAPVLELVSRTIDFGVVKRNAKYTQTLQLKNTGINPLQIHRVYSRSTESLTAKSSTTTLQSNQSTTIHVVLNTKNLKPANYTRQIEIITNDPQHARTYITVTWRIEE